LTNKGSDATLTRSDAWILASLISAGGATGIVRLIAEADYLKRARLTYDELSFGLPRLAAEHLVLIAKDPLAGLVLTATPRACALVVPGPSIQVMFNLTQTLGCRPYPEEEIEDRSLGRLPGLELSAVESAVAENGSWRSKVPSQVWAALDKTAADQTAAGGPTTQEKRRKNRRRAGTESQG
jgi:hypothetical protein